MSLSPLSLLSRVRRRPAWAGVLLAGVGFLTTAAGSSSAQPAATVTPAPARPGDVQLPEMTTQADVVVKGRVLGTRLEQEGKRWVSVVDVVVVESVPGAANNPKVGERLEVRSYGGRTDRRGRVIAPHPYRRGTEHTFYARRSGHQLDLRAPGQPFSSLHQGAASSARPRGQADRRTYLRRTNMPQGVRVAPPPAPIKTPVPADPE